MSNASFDLFTWLRGRGLSPDGAMTIIYAYRGQVAHELAEKQRALDVTTLTPLSPEEQRLVRLGVDCAADKIDPEVKG